MTEKEYRNLRKIVYSFEADLINSPVELSDKAADSLWRIIGEGAGQKDIPHDADARFQKAKSNLQNFVLSSGAFLYDQGRCFFIDYYGFDIMAWQQMRVPISDVTRASQVAFRKDLNPNLRTFLNENWTSIIFVIAVIIVFILID